MKNQPQARGSNEALPVHRVDALVLAGRRRMAGFGGQAEPHKALLPLDGVPMLARVLATLSASPTVGTITVSIDDAAVVESLPTARELLAAGRLRCRTSGASPAASVAEALDDTAPGRAVLVTTADHPLLTPAAVERFAAEARAGDADVVAAMVSAAVFRARFPEVRRTFIRLRDDGFCGANLFLFRTPAGSTAARFWREAERHRKRPWRLAAVFGAATLAGFALRRFDLSTALERASKVIGVRAGVVLLDDPEIAIDVDSPADAELAERILAERAAVAR